MSTPQAPTASPRPAAIALVLATGAILLGAVFFGGASGPSSVARLGVAVVVAAAAVVVAAAYGALRLPTLDRPGRVAVAAATVLTTWVGLSILWSIAGDRSWDALGKSLVYLGATIVGLSLGASLGVRGARAGSALIAFALAAAVGWALLSRAVPALFPDGDRIPRLQEPVGYWNALALLAGAAAPFGLWLATAWRGRLGSAAGALLVYAAVLTTLLTQSRAGVLAAVAVSALWLALSAHRLAGALLGVCGTVPAAVVAGWAFMRPALVDAGASRADRVSDGAVFAALTLLAGAIVVGLALWLPVRRLVDDHARQLVRGLVAACAALVAVGAVGLAIAVGNPFTWASDQVSGGECANTPGRLAELCANNRIAWWGDALDVFGDHPIAGTGALTYEIARKRVREDGTPVAQPHSVPLQGLADLGLVGLLAGGAFVLGAGAGIVAAVRRLIGPEREAASALVALPVAYALHALVDYDLDFVAVTVPALTAVGVLLAAGRPAATIRARRLAAVAASATCVAVVAVLVSPALAEGEVDRSTRLLDEGKLAAAANAADRARSLDPLALDPLYAAAAAAERAGNPDLARAFHVRATELQPENPEPWIALGIYEFAALRDMCRAYQALNAAYTLDPKGRQWVPGGPLDQARDAVNAGACER
jgi:hypothetical protein